MHIQHAVSLANFSTMRLGGLAAHLVEIYDRDQLQEAVAWASGQSLPMIMIGGGSNLFWRDEGFAGLVIVNKIVGYKIIEDNGQEVTLQVGAGENWDDVVARTVEDGLTGIEALSLIPGTTGGTPVQNVGAYGQEISQTMASVIAFDRQTNGITTVMAADCDLGYRTSRFKTNNRGRFFITDVVLRLARGNPQPPFYPAVQAYLDQHSVSNPNPQAIRQAVIAIRQTKLPDPAKIANNGSFFANPIISQAQLATIQASTVLNVPQWPTQEGLFKVAAAWLVEQAGFKDYHDSETGMATWPSQSLVLVNETARRTTDLLAFKQKIVDAVQTKFGVTLEQEPELLP